MRHKDGLIGLSACLKGEVSSLLLKGEKQKAKDIAKEFEDILGKGNFYLELMDHGIEEQIKVNSEIIKISKELDIPLVATNDCHYLNREDSKAHEVLLCIQTGKTLEDKTHMKFSTEEFYFKTPQEMKTLFAEVPSAIKNTIVIAQHCNLELKFDTFYLPKYDLPSEHTDIDEYLEKLCRDGLKKHFPQNTSQEVENRLKHELEVVKNADFPDTFLLCGTS